MAETKKQLGCGLELISNWCEAKIRELVPMIGTSAPCPVLQDVHREFAEILASIEPSLVRLLPDRFETGKHAINHLSLWRKNALKHTTQKRFQATGNGQAMPAPSAAELEAPPTSGESDQVTTEDKAKKARRKPGELNGRMLDIMQNRPDTRGWTCGQWASELGVRTEQITRTKAWKELQEHRKEQRVTKRKSKRRGRVGK